VEGTGRKGVKEVKKVEKGMGEEGVKEVECMGRCVCQGRLKVN